MGLATFPDGSVICGPLVQHAPSPDALGEKAEHYRAIPSLRDYVIVSHRERRITVHSRSGGGHWHERSARAGERVAVTSLNTDLAVDEVYRKSSVT